MHHLTNGKFALVVSNKLWNLYSMIDLLDHRELCRIQSIQQWQLSDAFSRNMSFLPAVIPSIAIASLTNLTEDLMSKMTIVICSAQAKVAHPNWLVNNSKSYYRIIYGYYINKMMWSLSFVLSLSAIRLLTLHNRLTKNRLRVKNVMYRYASYVGLVIMGKSVHGYFSLIFWINGYVRIRDRPGWTDAIRRIKMVIYVEHLW